MTPYVDNPEDAEVTYNWTFPVGTQGEGIGADGRISLKEPTTITAVFNQFGTLNVTLQVNLGEKSLDPITQKVNINYDQKAKTLYYAVKGGNIMAKKLVEGISDDVNQPFDTQYKSGKHPLTLIYSNDLLYVFDAGTKTGYVEDSKSLGDGEIFTINAGWNRRETIIENKGGDSYLDFFYGYIDEEQGRLHFADRRDGIRWIPLTTRNAKFDEDTYTYWVENNRLGYYGNGIAYGATNGPFFKHNNGVWYWGKNTLAKGFFRFTESDVDQTTIPSAGAIMTNYSIRGLAIDNTNNLLYFSNSMGNYMVGAANMETGDLVAVMDQSPTDSEGGASEPLYVTGIAADTDYVYWGYRADTSSVDDDGQPLNTSGIKRVKISEVLEGGYVTDKVDFLVPNVDVYGIAIDHTLR